MYLSTKLLSVSGPLSGTSSRDDSSHQYVDRTMLIDSSVGAVSLSLLTLYCDHDYDLLVCYHVNDASPRSPFGERCDRNWTSLWGNNVVFRTSSVTGVSLCCSHLRVRKQHFSGKFSSKKIFHLCVHSLLAHVVIEEEMVRYFYQSPVTSM